MTTIAGFNEAGFKVQQCLLCDAHKSETKQVCLNNGDIQKAPVKAGKE